MLLILRDFIQREQVVSTQQLAREFHIDEQALQPMIDILVKKGAIKPCHEKAGCQSVCAGCKTNVPVFYEWIEKVTAIAQLLVR